MSMGRFETAYSTRVFRGNLISRKGYQLKMIKLIKDMVRMRHDRKDYKIKWEINLGFEPSICSLLPTIVVQPWIYRYVDVGLIDITWLFWHLSIGTWKRKS